MGQDPGMTILAYAAAQAAGRLQQFNYDPGILKGDEVQVDVEYC